MKSSETSSEVACQQPISLSDRFPEEVVQMMKAEIGEWRIGLREVPHLPWNQSGFSLDLVVERELLLTAKIVMEKASKILLRKKNAQGWELESAIDRAVQAHIKSLVDAARLPPRLRNYAAQIEKSASEMKAELKQRVANLNREVSKLEATKKRHCRTMNVMAIEFGYPDVPAPICNATEDGDRLPSSPGIYFVWKDGVVVYVGQSVRLNSRAKLGHERIMKGDLLSWLEFPFETLDFAEAFYIGIARPSRNFGKRAKCNGTIEKKENTK